MSSESKRHNTAPATSNYKPVKSEGSDNTQGYGGAHGSKSASPPTSRNRQSSGSTRPQQNNSNSSSSSSGLYNRLHPPSSMPPEQYDPLNFGYSASNAPRPSHHFARIPPQKKSELWARVARLEDATRQYVDHRAQNALKRSMLPDSSQDGHSSGSSGSNNKGAGGSA